MAIEHLVQNVPELREKYLFTSDKRPVNSNSRKGIPNRATVLAKWLNTKMKTTDLQGNEVECTASDAVVLAQIRKAVAMGDTNAAVFLLGNAPKVQEGETAEIKPLLDMSSLSTEELKQYAAIERKLRGLPPIDEGEYIESEPVTEE